MRAATAPSQEQPVARGAPEKLAPALPRRVQRLILSLILVASAILQFYRLDDWQTFSDDQATQMNVVHGLLVDHHVPLLGLALAVGQAHIGPLFYYLLALPMWLGQALVGYLDPTAGVAMLGLFQVATVYLLYRLCLLVAAPWAALCAAGLYATSGLVVYWSRFLWPNCAPFFVVLALCAMIALAQGRPRALIVLAGSLAAAAQLQPTAVLLIPVAALWLLAVRPRLTWRVVLAALGLVVLLFAPVIVYDLTHHFAELRAWLGYGATVRPSTAPRNGLWRGLQELERFGWRAVGFRTRSLVDLLLALASVAVAASAAGLAGPSRALLARLLILWALVYLLAFSLYRGELHPHYVEPLYPLPFLAIGLLLDLVVMAALGVSRRIRGYITRLPSHIRPLVRLVPYAATAAVVLGLAGANVHHLWRDDFGLDPFQLDSPSEIQGNRVTLGEMRQAAGLIAQGAAHQPYSFLVAVRDGDGGGFAYLQRHSGAVPASTPRPLQFLLVEPAERPPWLWPPATRLSWSQSRGGFIRLPHLLLWRLQAGRGSGTMRAPWRQVADTAGAATSVAVLPGHGGSVFVAYLGGAALSTDGGRTWRPAAWPATTNGGLVVTSVAWSAACPRRLYAGTFDGVLVSRDGGASWRRSAGQPDSPEVLAVRADPRRCGSVAAGTRAGIALTRDGGAHWLSTPIGGPNRLAVQALAGSPNGRTLYAGTTDGVWISHDGGQSWPARLQRHEPRPALSLLIHPSGTPLLFAGSGDGMRYSDDGGVSWGPKGQGLSGVVYALLAIDGHGTLLAGADGGLYISHDNGAWWDPIPALAGVTVSALAGGMGHAVYAATGQGLYRSDDGGRTWVRAGGR